MPTMLDVITVTISVLALAVSIVTAWLTLIQRGSVRMTKPTVIYFGPDGTRKNSNHYLPKVYIRSLLYSTSKMGRIVESMYISLSRNESIQNFSIWVHGGPTLKRGSGLYVGENGYESDHHFLTPKDGSEYAFKTGVYRLSVFAWIVGDRKKKLLFCHEFEISPEIAAALEDPHTGVYFDWGPDAGRYIPHIDKRRPLPDPEDFIEALRITSRYSGQGE
jgi:hypothetical protein